MSNKPFSNTFMDKKPGDITPPQKAVAVAAQSQTDLVEDTPVTPRKPAPKPQVIPKTQAQAQPVPNPPLRPAVATQAVQSAPVQSDQIQEQEESAIPMDIMPSESSQEVMISNQRSVGLENMDMEDILTPELKIVQKTHDAILEKFDNCLGKIYNTAEESISDFVEVVIIYFAKSRSYFDESNRSGPRICYSLNRIRPHGGSLYKLSDNVSCAICPEHEKCTDMYEYTVIPTDTLNTAKCFPYRFSLSGGGLKEARNFNKTLREIQEPYFHVFKISTQKKKWTENNTSYIPVFEYVRPTTPEERTLYQELTQRASQAYKATVAQLESACQLIQ